MTERFIWQPLGDGSSDEEFGNICDEKNEVIIAWDVHKDYGRLFCTLLNSELGKVWVE